MVIKGFKFGMLLQFMIGPVCIFIFQMSSSKGFYISETGVLGTALVDGVFILSAIWGIGSIVSRKNIKILLKITASIILFIFGLSAILAQFSINILPSLSISNSSSNNMFFKAVILTSSNPLTIIFWAGVFSGKLLKEDMNRKSMYAFGLGAVLSTLTFLTIVCFIGSFVHVFLSKTTIEIMNIAAGFLLMYFGIKTLIKGSE
ncbi:LysE family transporter [Clostridium sp. 19966]|uniref:LysE family translocator n=1 Tax=Clostridium sp. 19966 TaxID=2768166 RepID=UPI0028DF5994|nr:LysE family transporter [Clostridium sp. 19966]MDT8719751.1 LysE family transporter [Clostridium sp. 19966]